MKPKNKFQQRVFSLSKKLSPITEAQIKWAKQNCIEHTGKRTAKGVITCSECGHAWKGNSYLSDTVLDVKCPECSTKLKVITTLKRVFSQSAYFCIITSKDNFQVLRFVLIKYYSKIGSKAEYFISEVIQRWIAPNGNYATVARIRPMSFYDYNWCFWSSLEIRPERDHHYITPTGVYPRQRLISEIKRSGFKGDFYNLSPFDVFQSLLKENKAETLMKTGQTDMFKFFVRNKFRNIESYWASIRICIRNRYHIDDVSIWRDYIDLLRHFGKDIHNAKYVCPTDLKAEHDRYVRKRQEQIKQEQEQIQRERDEAAKQKALKDEAKFIEMKSKFFGIKFSDDLIQIRVLESVVEVIQEGKIMHHCVFTNSYHLRPDSLILSASIDDKHIETIEISLSRLEVIQCRGVCNKNTKYHERILTLVNKNIRLIKKRLAA